MIYIMISGIPNTSNVFNKATAVHRPTYSLFSFLAIDVLSHKKPISIIWGQRGRDMLFRRGAEDRYGRSRSHCRHSLLVLRSCRRLSTKLDMREVWYGRDDKEEWERACLLRTGSAERNFFTITLRFDILSTPSARVTVVDDRIQQQPRARLF